MTSLSKRSQSILVVLLAVSVLAGCAEARQDRAAKLASQASFDLNGGRFEAALSKIQKASVLRPEVAEYHVGVAIAASKLGRSELRKIHLVTAQRILKPQSEKDPDRVDDYALVLALLDRKGDAADAFRVGLDRFPGSKVLREMEPDFESILDGWIEEYEVTTSAQ